MTGQTLKNLDDPRSVGKALAEARKRSRLTQGEVAEALKVSRGAVAQWEGGRHVPSSRTARNLAEVLPDIGSLLSSWDKLRGAEQARGADGLPPDQAPPTMNELFADVRASLIDAQKNGDEIVGWTKNLPPAGRHQAKRPRPLATAYAVKTLLLFQDPGLSHSDFARIRASLLDQRRGAGGWADPDWDVATPEVTAVVVDALARMNRTEDLDQYLDVLQAQMSTFERERPLILSIVLETVAEYWPESDLARDLAQQLLQTALGGEWAYLWPADAHPSAWKPLPSVAHTARALRALVRARAAMPRDRLPDDVDTYVERAFEWLVDQTDLSNVQEILDPLEWDSDDDRPSDNKEDGRRRTYTHWHFTAAWVLRALIEGGKFERGLPAVRQAEAELWKCYDPEVHFWILRNGAVPIWMTFDAIETLIKLNEFEAIARVDLTRVNRRRKDAL